MPKPLSKIREENRSASEYNFPRAICEEVLSHFSTSESRIIEGIKEWAKEAELHLWSPSDGGALEKYSKNYNEALSDLLAFLDEGLTNTK